MSKLSRLWRPISQRGARPLRPTHLSGGTNLEVFKFGMYIMFPIGWMYYFGTNLETRFTIPDFWPKPEETNRIPFEKEEQIELKNALRERRLENRRRRLGLVQESADPVVTDGQVARDRTFGRGVIERWARGD